MPATDRLPIVGFLLLFLVLLPIAVALAQPAAPGEEAGAAGDDARPAVGGRQRGVMGAPA